MNVVATWNRMVSLTLSISTACAAMIMANVFFLHNRLPLMLLSTAMI